MGASKRKRPASKTPGVIRYRNLTGLTRSDHASCRFDAACLPRSVTTS